MTPQKLRSFKGFETITDDDAEQIIHTLEQFCTVVCKHITSYKR